MNIISFENSSKFNSFVSSKMGKKTSDFLPGIDQRLSNFLSRKGYGKVR